MTLGILDGTTNVATPLADDSEVIGIVRVNPALNKVYVGAQETAADPTVVYILDGTTDEMVTEEPLQVGSPTPFIGTQSYLAVNVTTGRVFVADYDHDKVDVHRRHHRRDHRIDRGWRRAKHRRRQRDA